MPKERPSKLAAAPASGDVRVAPHSLDAERAVLGVVIAHADALDLIDDLLEADDFFRAAHATIFAALRSLHEAGQPTDLVALKERLQSRGQLDDIGGPAYLASLTDGVPRSTNIRHYADIVKEKARLRFAIAAGERLVREAFEHGDRRSADLLSDTGERLIEVGGSSVPGRLEPLSELLTGSIAQLESEANVENGYITGVPTGFAKLDGMTAGLQPTDFIIIAARTSQGKTALALNIATHAAEAAKGVVAIFSMEMSKHQLIVRLLASLARVDGHRLRTGNLNDDEWPKVADAMQRLHAMRIFIDETPHLGVREVRARCRQIKREHGLSLVLLDYIQLMRGRGKFDNRTQEIGLISRGCKALAKELGVPLVALAQLSRAPEAGYGRKARPPQLSDLRESGDLEADADMVLLLWRPDRKKDDAAEDDNPRSELIVAKQRNGPTGSLKMTFLKAYATFDAESAE